MTTRNVTSRAGGASAPLRFAPYIRVSTAKQGRSGLGLEAQERAIRAFAAFREVHLTETTVEVVSGAAKRLPLREALFDQCRAGQLDGVVVAKLDRLGRSAAALLAVADDAKRHHYRVMVADQNLTMPGDTPNDRMFLGILSVLAEFERDTTSERTIECLAEARERGVQLGRPRVLPDAVRISICRMAADGMGASQIARKLTADGVPTARGNSTWQPSSVREILTTS